MVQARQVTVSTKNGKKASVEAPAVAEADMYLFDAIGSDFFGDGISAKDVVGAVKDFEAGGATKLNLYINSPGGDVFEASAIYNAISRFAANGRTVDVYVEGLAASAASFVAMVGDTINMAPNSMMMIHNPWGFVAGDAAAMRSTADALDKVATTIVGMYVEQTKLAPGEVSSMMDKETWMTADEALKLGFATAILKPGDAPLQSPDQDPDVPEDPDEENPDEEKSPTPGLPVPEARASDVGLSLLAKYKNTPAALKPSAKDLIASMERRIMDFGGQAHAVPGKPGK